ncbi:MAG: Crp/Fnr family transcriptional regulator [Hyphomicrobiales bacterium]
MLPVPFNSLPNAALKTKQLTKGEILFRQSDPPSFLYFLRSGHVQLRRHTEAGEDIIIHNAHGGQTFAEASLFSSNYHCDAIACEASELVAINKIQILKTMRQNSLFAFALSARFATEMQAQRRKLELFSIKSAPQRIFAAIADGMLTGSVTALAADIGLTHEATYRALSQLTRQGKLVKTGRGRYELRKIESRTTG